MFRAPFFGSLTVGITSSFSELRVVHDATLVLLGCAMAIVSLHRGKKLHRALGKTERRLVPYIVGGVFAVAGVLANSAGRTLGVTADAFYVVSIVVLCMGFAILVTGWFHVLVGIARDKVATLVMGAFVVSHIFGILDVLPREWASFLSALYPLFALIALCLLRDSQIVLGMRGSEPALQDAYLRKVQICAMVLIFAEIFCGAFLRCRWGHGGVNYVPHARTIYSYLVSAIIGLVFLWIALRSKTTAECTLAIGSIGLIGFMGGTLLFAFVSPAILSPFVTGLYSALLVYSMALICLWGSDSRHSSLACAALFLCTYGLASGITYSVIPALLVQLQLTPADFLFPVSIAAGIAVSLGMCAVLFIMVIVHRRVFLGKLEQGAQEKSDDVEQTPSLAERHDLAMDLLAERYDLTEREQETASLMARGYTVRRVAEELVVAESTIKGYSKSIYRKMGIHRKDELIAMVNEAKKRV